MQDFEKLGMFYLGKEIDPSNGKMGKKCLLYPSKDLTTHAVCVGMTGSGKTGLGITLLEEAGIDKIPAIIIDPKGDLANLLLTFPNLSPEDFQPWVHQDEAESQHMTTEQLAASTAQKWKEGLKTWDEDGKRIQKLKDAVEITLYTPASNAGIPISILNSFAAPSPNARLDGTALREKALSVTASLLSLIGINVDPIKSREYILISTLIELAWQNGKDLDLADLVGQVQHPPFTKIGALDPDTFYPPKERLKLSISLNNLLASPGFQAWMEGDPLDIKQLLYTPQGKPKLSIISIAHLSDSERMFFVTLLLNQFISWMREQSGTSSLRALLYMDEIFGFFPPTAMPPSKLPMLTLLKQARAFGVGIVLVTQNPVDLDYKGLANCGTWFIGKLQTERDKKRVIEGLQIASNGELDANTLNEMLALTGNRTFIMRSVHEKNPLLFQTRWTLSYLYGPLTLPQIASLKPQSKEKEPVRQIQETGPHLSSKPNLPNGIEELFLQQTNSKPIHYVPCVLGVAKLHFVDSKKKIDLWKEIYALADASDEGKRADWEKGKDISNLQNKLQKQAPQECTFGELPFGLTQLKNYAAFEKDLAKILYQSQTYPIFQCLDLISKEGESESDFKARAALALRETKDGAVQKLREKYAKKINALSEKLERAKTKVEAKQQKAGEQKAQTLISFGSTVVGAIFGRKMTKGTISQTGSTLRRATRMRTSSQDAARAEEDVRKYQQQLQELEAQIEKEVSSQMANQYLDPKVETFIIRPRKSDITIEKIALLWWPTP